MPTDQQPLTALVADDDRDIRELVAAKLRQAGFEVSAVSDGAAALASVREHAPTIAIIDVMMPGLSGLDFVEQVRADHPEVALILLSARSREFDVRTGIATGADAYIVKPFSLKDLMRRVDEVLERGH